MSTIYVDPVAGSDSSGTGTEIAPVKTISKALTLAASASSIGDTICLAGGIYRETVVVPPGKAPLIYGRGLCIVDGEGIRECIDISNGASADEVKSYWANVIFRNPGTTAPTNVFIKEKKNLSSTVETGRIQFFNCSFYVDSEPGAGVTLISIENSFNFVLRMHHCTIKKLTRIAKLTSLPASSLVKLYVNDTVVDVSSTTNPFTSTATGTGTPTNAALSVARVAYPGGSGTGNVNITTTAYPYRDSTYPNPDLSPNYAGGNIASYRGTGEKGSNIGSFWFPVFGHSMSMFQTTTDSFGKLTAWRDPVSGQDWITDPNYPDGSLKGPAVRVNDSTGDHFEIDTASLATARSARVLGPVVKVPVKNGDTALFRMVVREADEDTAPSAGSKKVIDSTFGDASRTKQYRASTAEFAQTSTGVAFTDVSLTADLSVSFTQTFWIQEAVILTTLGS